MQNKSKLCFSTLGCSDDTLDEIFALCKKFGVGNIEIRGICGELNNCKISDFSPEKYNLISAEPLLYAFFTSPVNVKI